MAGCGALSPLAKWILDRYGGTDPNASLMTYAEGLIKTVGIERPPVRLSLVAKWMGLDPRPVYRSPREQGEEGCLQPVHGAMRITLRTPDGLPPKQNSTGFYRMRFTYAHELAHALFYDLESEPQCRTAPAPSGREEEEVCNHVAGRLLVPPFLLATALEAMTEPSLHGLQRAARMFQVSLFCLLVQAEEVLSSRLAPNMLYMVSLNSEGVRGTRKRKPRCIACYLPDSMRRQGFEFLNTYQGIDNVKKMGKGGLLPWSLVAFYQDGQGRPRGRSGTNKEVLRCPNGRVVELDSVHFAIPNTSYVWTEARIELR